MIKAKIKQELKKTFLEIEIETPYKEDYQIPMLQLNAMKSVLPIFPKEVDGRSYYSYEISGLISMKTQYEKMKIEREDMENFIQQLIYTMQEVKKYLLDVERLILEPEYIFCKGDCFYFCYLPISHQKLCAAFHGMTEYFVCQVNYEKMDAVKLAVELHKTSMIENYDIEQILDEFHKSEKQELLNLETDEDNLFSMDEEEEQFEKYESYKDVQTVKETSGALGWIKKNLHCRKKEKWGTWEGLITEEEMEES